MYLQYFHLCVLVSLICSAVFLQASSVLKLALLCLLTAVFSVFVTVTHVELFDNRDILLRAHVK